MKMQRVELIWVNLEAPDRILPNTVDKLNRRKTSTRGVKSTSRWKSVSPVQLNYISSCSSPNKYFRNFIIP